MAELNRSSVVSANDDRTRNTATVNILSKMVDLANDQMNMQYDMANGLDSKSLGLLGLILLIVSIVIGARLADTHLNSWTILIAVFYFPCAMFLFLSLWIRKYKVLNIPEVYKKLNKRTEIDALFHILGEINGILLQNNEIINKRQNLLKGGLYLYVLAILSSFFLLAVLYIA